jgi:hypothetical protein
MEEKLNKQQQKNCKKIIKKNEYLLIFNFYSFIHKNTIIESI